MRVPSYLTSSARLPWHISTTRSLAALPSLPSSQRLPPPWTQWRAFKARASRSGPRSPGPSLPFQWKRVLLEDDLPPIELWEARLKVSGYLAGLLPPTAEKCQQIARRYCAQTSSQDRKWQSKLGKEHNINPRTLHGLAALLVLGPTAKPWGFALHMLSTASNLGFDPSTLLLAHIRGRLQPYVDQIPPSLQSTFREARDRFQSIVRLGRDPDALTLHGITLSVAEKKPLQALEFLDRAIQTGSSHVAGKGEVDAVLDIDTGSSQNAPQQTIRRPRWTWEHLCHVRRASILLQYGRREEAEAALRVAAFELDTAEGYLELAKLLPRGDPSRRDYLLKAAMPPNERGQEACRLLAEDELQMATESGQTKAEARDHSSWAACWFDLAGDREAAAGAQWAHLRKQ